MGEFFEIDFFEVGTTASGDAIAIRYQVSDVEYIHVVDGGYQETGPKFAEHIRKYYSSPERIDHVLVTHPDGDHAGGLRTILEEFQVGTLWMLCPWHYATELIDRFSKYTSIENLERRLRELYPNLAALEKLAIEKRIPIREPFQGAVIGQFISLTPTKARFLDLIVDSERTPEAAKDESEGAQRGLMEAAGTFVAKVVNFIRAAWGDEVFSPNETSAENEMSVVQFAHLCQEKILLTGDAGRAALAEAVDYAGAASLVLPGIDRFQVPHHGSRRNVSTDLLDRLLGPKLLDKPEHGEYKFTAVVSAGKDDDDHPRKAVVRAMIHRGGKVVMNKTGTLCTSRNAPEREEWNAAVPADYPDEQENE